MGTVSLIKNISEPVPSCHFIYNKKTKRSFVIESYNHKTLPKPHDS